MASDPTFCDDFTVRPTLIVPVEGKLSFGGFGGFTDRLTFGLIAADENQAARRRARERVRVRGGLKPVGQPRGDDAPISAAALRPIH